MKKTRIALACALLFSLAGCLGSDGGSSTVSGRFLDAAVSGIDWQASRSGKSGTTGDDGRFECRKGDTVSFSLADIELGNAACAATVTPLELAGVAAWSASTQGVYNRLLLLQILDDDDNPANGIRITPAVIVALAGKTIDFTLAAGDFRTALAALLPAGVNDAFGQPYAARVPNDEREALAREHFEGTLATALGQGETSSQAQASAGGTIAVTKYTLAAADALHVAYPGSNAAIAADFPHGFFPAAGSGLAFKGKASDGTLSFYGITDRGPNGDAPATVSNPDGKASKVFPSPDFVPSIATIVIDRDGARIDQLLTLKTAAGTPISGRPVPAGAVGNSGEIPLTDAFTYDATRAGYDSNGLDPESLIYDSANGVFWTSDEYGPFIAKIDAATGKIVQKYQPGTAAGDLPAVLAHRRANRGMEGLTMSGGVLHGFLQSPIDPFDAKGKSIEAVDISDLDEDGKTSDKVKVKDFARFARWLAFDPATGTSHLYAYPLDYAIAGEKWSKNRSGSAKLGDVVALGNNRFLVIEQGADANGAVRNFLMLVELPANATDIAGDGYGLEMNSIDGSTLTETTRSWASVVPLRKRLLVDLNALGWKAEKAEGLTLVDGQTIALINDNDFGLRSILVDAAGNEVDGSPEDCTLDASTGALSNCPNAATGARVTRGKASERPTRLWLLKLPQALSSYTMN